MKRAAIVVAMLSFAILGISQTPKDKRIAVKNGALDTAPASSRKKNQQYAASPPSQTIAIYNQSSPAEHNGDAKQSQDAIDVERQLAKFTGYLVGVGLLQFLILAVQAVLFFQQKNIMGQHKVSLEKLATAASDNAKAALLNAEALINAERPWVMIQIEKIPGDNPAKSTFQLSLFNYGKSPAHIISCDGPKTEFYEDPDKELSIPPEYGTWEWDKRFLAPRDSLAIRDPINPHIAKIESVTQAAVRGVPTKQGLMLVVYGLIQYNDGISTKAYKTAFCYRHQRSLPSDMGGSLVLCGPRVYNEYT